MGHSMNKVSNAAEILDEILKSVGDSYYNVLSQIVSIEEVYLSGSGTVAIPKITACLEEHVKGLGAES